MSSLTAYLQKKLGDHAIGKASYTMPTVHLALLSASPGEAGSLTSEFSGGSYARVALTAKMGAADSTTGISLNTSVVTFPSPTAAWGSLVYAAIVDASSGGNVLFYMPVGNPIVVNNGDPAPSFPIGSISVSIAGALSIMITSYLMKKLVDHALGKSAYTMPIAVYHLLLASNPTIAGTLSSEVGVGAYARQELTSAMSVFDATTGIASNTTALAYPTPTADYPSVNYTGIADAASAGNLLFADQLPSALVIRNAQAPARFPTGSINLQFD
jgi:hypothetical protein